MGSVLTYGDSDWAGDADRFSVTGTASWLRGELGWYPIIASSRKQSTIALSSGEAELVAALSATCEGMGLRQQWKCLRQFGCEDEEKTEASHQILGSDSSAALAMIKRKGSTRKTRHIELKALFLQQWSSRQEVRLVQVGTGEMLAYCLTKIQSTPNSVHFSKLGLEIKSSLIFDLILVAKIERRRGVEIPVFFSTILILLSLRQSFFAVSDTNHTFYNELRVDALHPRSF